MNLTFAANLTKMIDAGLGREAAPPETFVAVGRTTEYTDLGPVPIASFETNVEAPLRALSVSMEPIQDLHGQANPYPGGASVNKLNPDTVTTGKKLNNVGELTDGSAYCVSDWIPVEPNTDYCAEKVIAANGYAFCFYDANKSFLKYEVLSGTTPISGVRNSGADAAYARITVQLESLDSALFAQSSSVIPFAPYSNICPISGRDTVKVWHESIYEASADPAIIIPLGRTVYGGNLDVVSGVLTDKWKSIRIRDVTWQKSDGMFYSTFTSRKSQNTRADILCSAYGFYATTTWSALVANMPDKAFGTTTNSAQRYVAIKDSTYSSVAAFIAAMGEQTFAWEMTSSYYTTVQLAPEQITTLIGANNVWSDGGDVSLTYGTTRYTEGY